MQRAIFFSDVVKNMNTQSGSAMTKYKAPDYVTKQRNENLQKHHDATVVPADHWTRNKYLNNFSERAVEPMVEMAIGEGLGRVAIKGLSLLLKAKGSKLLDVTSKAALKEFEYACPRTFHAKASQY
jgi:hypothetical protein